MATFSTSLALCVGNLAVTGEFLAQRPVTRNFDVFFDLRLKKRLQYEPKKFCRRAAESGRLLRDANRRLPTPSGNGGERQTPVIFTPQAVLDPMLQTMMDPGTSLPVIPLRRSLPPGWRVATPFEVCTCMHFAHCTPAELSRNT